MSHHVAIVLAAAAAALLAVPAAGAAQGLGDVARQEAERRSKVVVPGKVYTNDNLTPDFTQPAPPPAAAPPADVAPPAVEPAAAEEAGEGATPPDQQQPQPQDDKDESFWRTQAATIRARLADQNLQIEQLRARLDSFPAGQDAGERALVQQTLQKAIVDLGFLNDEWLRFEQSARQRNIPESWIR